MLKKPSIWLSILIASVCIEVHAKPTFVPNGLSAPTVTDWPKNLPKAYRLQSGHTCLPPALEREVIGRLMLLEVYPVACADTIKANRKHAERVRSIDLEACEIRCKLKASENETESLSQWEWWEVGLMVLGGLGVGFTSGYITRALQK